MKLVEASNVPLLKISISILGLLIVIRDNYYGI